MGASNGARFVARVDSTKRELWYGDEKITYNASKHPAFKGIVMPYQLSMTSNPIPLSRRR